MTRSQWAASGVMALTGWPDGPPLAPEADVADRLDSLVGEVASLSGVLLDWADLLAGRAAMLGFSRQGRISANGSCRLVGTADGWVALNLARPHDVECVPALVQGPVGGDPWPAVTDAAAGTAAAGLVDRGRLLGLPITALGAPGDDDGPAATTVSRRWPAGQVGGTIEGRRVVDLSALWAGPLAARILAAAGADVVKVESTARPDGARANPDFYQWLHPDGQEVLRIDFSSEAGRRRLGRVVDGAEVVIESSRPRALRQLGSGPDDVAAAPGRVWLSITGYGRRRDWVAFGDDAAVAGGLVAWDGDGGPVFCGDAIADPLSGLYGALDVLRAIDAGGGVLIDLAMAGVAAAMAGVAAAMAAPGSTEATARRPASEVTVSPPRRPAPFPARITDAG